MSSECNLAKLASNEEDLYGDVGVNLISYCASIEYWTGYEMNRMPMFCDVKLYYVH